MTPKPCFARLYSSVFAANRKAQESNDRNYEPLSWNDFVRCTDKCVTMRARGAKKSIVTDESKKKQPAVIFQNEVGAATALVLDYDHLQPEEFVELQELVSRNNVEYLLHTTTSSTKKKPRCRVIFPLSAPIEAKQVSLLLKIVVKRHGLLANYDKHAASGGRRWFLPTISIEPINLIRGKSKVRLNPIEYLSVSQDDYVADENGKDGLAHHRIPRKGTKKPNAQIAGLEQVVGKVLLEMSKDKTHTEAVFMRALEECSIKSVLGTNEANDPDTIMTYVKCPCCGNTRAYVSYKLNTKRAKIECYRASCTESKKGYQKSLNASMKELRPSATAVVSELFKLAKVAHYANVSKNWWNFDGVGIFSNSNIANALREKVAGDITETLKSVSAKRGAEIRHDAGSDFTGINALFVEMIAEKLKALGNSQFLSSDRLHVCSVSPEEIMRDFEGPHFSSIVGRRQLCCPSISLGSKNKQHKLTHKESKIDPIAKSRLMMLGHLLNTRKTLMGFLRRLPPIAIVELPRKTTRRERESDVLMFRQRLMLLLERGCHVVVCAPKTSTGCRDVVKEMKLKRTCISSWKNAIEMLPKPAPLFGQDP